MVIVLTFTHVLLKMRIALMVLNQLNMFAREHYWNMSMFGRNIVILIGQFAMKRGKRFKEFRRRIMLFLKLYESVIKFKIHYVQSFSFQFLWRPTTSAKRSGTQLGTESHRAWFSVIMSHFTSTLPANLASLSALWAASETLTTLSANRAVKSNAPVSSCFL